MIKNYLKLTFRNILKYKGYPFINIFGLAVGIAMCLLILMYVKHELSYDSYHENADRIVRVNLQTPDREISVTPSAAAPLLGNNLPEVENWVRIYEPTRYSPVIMKYGENVFQENSFFYADSSFFDIFSFEFTAGNPRTALDKPRNVVLTRSTAERLFGNDNPIGKTVEARVFSSIIDFEVTGVIEDVPDNSHFTFDYMASLSTRSDWSQLTDSEIRSANFYTYLLLNEAQALDALKQKAPSLISKYVPEGRDMGLTFMPLTDIYLHSDIPLEIRPMGSMNNVLGFTALAFLILIIATTNYVNLATARSSRRAAEVGIRKVLGANRASLIRQFYGESVVITIFSVILAVGLVEFFKAPFFEMLGKNIDLSIFSSLSTLLILALVTAVTALIAGGYPALVLSSYQPVKVLKGLFSTKGTDAVLRKGLVTFQFAASVFLIMSTIIIYQQTEFIMNKNLGFDKEQIVVLPARDNILSQKHELLKSEVLRQPGVVSASYISNVPGKVFGGYTAEYAPMNKQVNTVAGAADPDIVETMGLNVLAGQSFPSNPDYTPENGNYYYLINESLAQEFGWTPREAVNKEFNVLGNRTGKVIGVVQDFNYASLKENIDPLALFLQPDMYHHLMVKISPGNITGTMSSLGSLWDNLAPHRPFEFQFLDQELAALYENEMQTQRMISVFAVLGILIACLGLFGLSSYTIERRTKEIGIRKVLGASLGSIVGLLSLDFLKLVIAGFILAVPVGWYVMHRWLQDFAFRIDINVWVFVLAGITAILIALVTVSSQSVRAALSNPVDSLRSE